MSTTVFPGAMTPQGGHRRALARESMHAGSFATGQESIVRHPERPEERASFALGTELRKHVHQGSFAAGQAVTDPHPELPEHKGNFATGQRCIAAVGSRSSAAPGVSGVARD